MSGAGMAEIRWSWSTVAFHVEQGPETALEDERLEGLALAVTLMTSDGGGDACAFLSILRDVFAEANCLS